MSDQSSPVLPEVVVATKADGKHLALVHLGEKFRQIFADTMQSMEIQLAAVGVSEFGMEQEHARSFASDVVGCHVSTADELTKLREELPLLRDQLTETQAELEQAKVTIADLQKQIGALTTPPATDTPPQQNDNGVAAGATGPAAVAGDTIGGTTGDTGA